MAFTLNLIRPGDGMPERRRLEDGAYFIGRGASCAICLPFPEISERHAFVTLSGAQATIKDMRSANGTYVNGVAIDDLVPLAPDAVVQIGNCMLRFSPAAEEAPIPAPNESPSSSLPPSPPRESSPSNQPFPPSPSHESPPSNLNLSPLRAEAMRKAKEQIQTELLARLDLKRLTAQGVNREGLEAQAREKIHEIVSQVKGNGRLPKGLDADRLEREVFNEALRLGPLEDLLADETVTEIMVNGPHRVYVERRGRLELTDLQFTDDASVMAVIERIVAPLGRRIDESQPYVDARLADGSRVNAIIPPLSLSGPTVTIRKFAKRALTTEDFISYGTWTHNAAEFMRACVMLRKNIIVAGGPGSGKTTLLNLLSGFIPATERIVTVNCLRMRPDRIIVGECRGGEALDMLQAMNTGHDGSLTTVHANSPRDVISRLETMVLMSGMELPSRAIREQIASAVDVIIHESRLSDGSRKVVAISEVTGLEGQQIVMQDIFAFRQSGVDAHGRVIGRFAPTGAVPTFYENLRSRGLKLDPAIFDPSRDVTVNLEIAGER